MSFAPLRFALVLIAAWLGLSAVILAPGVFRITGHEVDLIQALDVSYRMADGLIPHLDFMTPLGVLSFVPISLFLERGYGPGHAYLFAQILVTALLLPGIWWVGVSRLEGRLRLFWGLGMVVLGTALIFGSAHPAITGAMFYNRWAWILAMMVVLVLMVPARAGWRAPVLDGVLLGVCGAVLVLLKVTFVVALAPFVLLVVLRDRRWTELVLGFAVMVAGLAAATMVFGGIAFWGAYISDLLAVSQLSPRAFPGQALFDLIAGPEGIVRTALLLAVIVLWRRAGRSGDGLALLVLAPGLIYITWQNWGNDPKYLYLLAILVLALPVSPTAKPILGLPAAAASKLLAGAALLLFAPSMINIATSHLRHMGTDAATYAPLFPGLDRADIEVETTKAYTPKAELRLPGDFLAPEQVLDQTTDQTPGDDSRRPLQTLAGEVLPDCSLRFGLLGWTKRAVQELAAFDEVTAQHVMTTDINDQLWMYGPFQRIDAQPPWYYGTTQGFDAATHVMVPFCPVSVWSRGKKLDLIEEAGWTLEEIARTELFILLRRTDQTP